MTVGPQSQHFQSLAVAILATATGAIGFGLFGAEFRDRDRDAGCREGERGTVYSDSIRYSWVISTLARSIAVAEQYFSADRSTARRTALSRNSVPLTTNTM